MGTLLQSSSKKNVRKVSNTKVSKSERLGWKSMSEAKHVSFRTLTSDVKSVDVSVLPHFYTSCAKII